jgi:hypothetical protein
MMIATMIAAGKKMNTDTNDYSRRYENTLVAEALH